MVCRCQEPFPRRILGQRGSDKGRDRSGRVVMHPRRRLGDIPERWKYRTVDRGTRLRGRGPGEGAQQEGREERESRETRIHAVPSQAMQGASTDMIGREWHRALRAPQEGQVPLWILDQALVTLDLVSAQIAAAARVVLAQG